MAREFAIDDEADRAALRAFIFDTVIRGEPPDIEKLPERLRGTARRWVGQKEKSPTDVVLNFWN